jgi:hypothetical protein
MRYVYNDGGRNASRLQGSAGDCVCRSIAIARGLPYTDVYRGAFPQSRSNSLPRAKWLGTRRASAGCAVRATRLLIAIRRTCPSSLS